MRTTVQIDSGAAVSGTLTLKTSSITGFIMPAAWTAAGMTFQVSADGTNFFDAFDSGGTELAFTVDAARGIVLSRDELAQLDWAFLRFRSGTTGVPVNQGADRVIEVFSK